MGLVNGTYDLESRTALIQKLIPIGLMAVEEADQAEVQKFGNDRYCHDDNPHKRWGYNLGSVDLGNQKQIIRVPRVRNQATGQEVSIKMHQGFAISSRDQQSNTSSCH